MNWLTSLFSSSNTARSRNRALSSTHEAFSLPTSSPMFPPTDFNYGPDPETATSASYTYPPQGSPYGYMPTSGGGTSRTASLLPMHHDALHSPMGSVPRGYPSLTSTWNRLKTWLAREYPELGDTLNYGILPEDLAQLELQFGFALPTVVRESYLTVDGQEAESAAGCSEGLFFGLTLLPLEDVYEEWRFWREVDEDPSTGANEQLRESMQSLPSNYVRRAYSERGWIPLIADRAGNYIGIDMNPGEKGAPGQVIVFGRDFDTKVVLFNGDGPAGWAKWLASFVEELESGDGFEIGARDDSGEGDEDDIGYESYFHDGTGRGQGDGGGDSSSAGGLRLAGEYRGWSVLEAWADKSVRKWYEAGVIVDEPEQEVEKPHVQVPEIILEDSPAVEVPLTAIPEEGAASSLSPKPKITSRKAPPNLPALSVTKPPAPLPLELPTPRDIVSLPSPPDSTHSSFDEDLESGRRPPTTSEQDVRVSNKSLQHTTPQHSASHTSPALLSRMSPPPENELLVDTAGPSDPIPTTEKHDVLVDDKVEEDFDPDMTIRLIGGGGQTGVAELIETESDSVEGMIEVDGTDTASITSDASSTSGADGKKHKKTKSGLSGLRKTLGGLRKNTKEDSGVTDATANPQS